MKTSLCNLLLAAIAIVAIGGGSAVHQNNTKTPMLFLNSPIQPYLTTADGAIKQNRTVLKYLASVTYDSSFYAVGPVCTVAMQLALERLRAQPKWLPNYQLQIDLMNDKGLEHVEIASLVKYLNGKQQDEASLPLPIYFTDNGMPLGQIVTSSIVRQYNYLSFTMMQETPELHYQRNRFRTEFGLGEPSDATFLALCEFIQQMGWRKIAVISELYGYFDSADRQLIPLLDRLNVTLLWMGKVTPGLLDEDEMSTAMQQMKARDPRIIVSNSNAPIAFSCWCYRFGMHGPKYAHFIQYWSYFDAEKAAIPASLPWCQRYMLREIAKTVFFFGTTIPTVLGNNVSDSTGWKFQDFQAELAGRVANAETSPAWSFWPAICYDAALFAGSLVNAAELRLNSQNSTLSEWIPQFQQEPNTNIFLETLFNTSKVKGFKGEYQFEASTTRNSLGFTPLTISQVQGDKLVLVGYHKSNEKKPFISFPKVLVWQTEDGLPPKDSINAIIRHKSLVSEAEAAVFAVIGLAGVIISVIFTAAPAISKTMVLMKCYDYATVVGLVLLFAHLCTYIAEVTPSHDSGGCHVYAALIAIGYSLSMAGLLNQLEQALAENRRRLPAINYACIGMARGLHEISSNVAGRCSCQTPPPNPNKSHNDLEARPIVFAAASFVVSTCLTIAWLARHPFSKMAVPQQIEQIDSGEIYQPLVYECSLSKSDSSSNGLLIGLVVTQTCLLLRMAFRAYVLRTENGRHLVREARQIFNCFCFVVFLLLVGAFTAVVNLGSGRFVQLTASSMSICFCVIVLGFKARSSVVRTL